VTTESEIIINGGEHKLYVRTVSGDLGSFLINFLGSAGPIPAPCICFIIG